MKDFNDIAKIEEVNNIKEIDPLSVNVNDFNYMTRRNWHIVTEAELNRFDIISYNEFGTTRWWWLILLYNDIIDPFEIKLNDNIAIPDLGLFQQISIRNRRINDR